MEVDCSCDFISVTTLASSATFKVCLILLLTRLISIVRTKLEAAGIPLVQWYYFPLLWRKLFCYLGAPVCKGLDEEKVFPPTRFVLENKRGLVGRAKNFFLSSDGMHCTHIREKEDEPYLNFSRHQLNHEGIYPSAFTS